MSQIVSDSLHIKSNLQKIIIISGSKEGTGSFLSPSLQLKVKLGEDAYLPCHPRGSGTLTLPPADHRERRVEVRYLLQTREKGEWKWKRWKRGSVW
jgi:hypothetical protein